MRSRFPLVLMTVAFLATLPPLASAQPADDASIHSDNARTLVGAWFINVTPSLAPAFASLGTFSADGTLTNISSSSMGFPPESPGYGAWVKVRRHTYAITFHTILGDGAGNFAGRGKIRATLTVGPDGDTLTGVFQVDVFDATGGLLFSDTGTVTGNRLSVESLP